MAAVVAKKLGYSISHKKSTLIPTQSMVHLGFGIDSRSCSFSISAKFRTKFKVFRDELLSRKTANAHNLQRWIGKCNHLRLVFPANSLFTYKARCFMMHLEQGLEERVPLPPGVLEEIEFWIFVDTFTEEVPFLKQQHVSVRLSTDASGFAWGASIDLPDGPLVLRDYWSSHLLGKDICAKEGLAVLFALQSIQERLSCRRVDVFVDNQGLMLAWNGLKARSEELVGVLRSLFLWTTDHRVSLRLHWIPTGENPADAPSRLLNRSDCMLSEPLRRKLWSAYGPFSFDLMALPSNVLCDPSGRPLPFFSHHPVPAAAGTNVFAQSAPQGRLYAYPPFAIITPLLRLLAEWGGVEIVIVLPVFQREAAWSGLLFPYVEDALPLFSRSACGVLQLPSSNGFHGNLLPLSFGMTAYRCRFPRRPPPAALAVKPAFRVLIYGDSILRPLERLSWPSPFRVMVHCVSGLTLSRLASPLHLGTSTLAIMTPFSCTRRLTTRRRMARSSRGSCLLPATL